MVSYIPEEERNAYLIRGYKIIREEIVPLETELGRLEITLTDNWAKKDIVDDEIPVVLDDRVKSQIGFKVTDHWSEDSSTDSEISPYDLYATLIEDGHGQVMFHWVPEQKVLLADSGDIYVTVGKEEYSKYINLLIDVSEKIAKRLGANELRFDIVLEPDKNYFLTRKDFNFDRNEVYKKI